MGDSLVIGGGILGLLTADLLLGRNSVIDPAPQGSGPRVDAAAKSLRHGPGPGPTVETERRIPYTLTISAPM